MVSKNTGRNYLNKSELEAKMVRQYLEAKERLEQKKLL